MPQQTDYNNFTHPIPNSIDTVDADQWALILADFFEDEVDETIVKRGDLVDRPSSGSSNNVDDYPRMYLSLDQTPALLSVDSATGWRDLNPLNLYAALDDDETVTGGWNFTQPTVFDDTIDVYGDQGHIDLFESDNSDKNWRFEAQNGDWQVTEVGVDTHLRIDSGQGGRVEHPNGAAFGDTVTFNAGGTFTTEFDGPVEEAGKLFGGGIVNGSHPDFASAQAALDFGDSNNYNTVMFSTANNYNAITIPNGMRVMGSTPSEFSPEVSFSTSGGGPTVSMGARTTLENVNVRNISGTTSDHGIQGGFRSQVKSVYFDDVDGDGVNTNDANEVLITHCMANNGNDIGGSSIQITGSSADCIARHNLNIGTVSNAGGGSNLIGNNT